MKHSQTVNLFAKPHYLITFNAETYHKPNVRVFAYLLVTEVQYGSFGVYHNDSIYFYLSTNKI